MINFACELKIPPRRQGARTRFGSHIELLSMWYFRQLLVRFQPIETLFAGIKEKCRINRFSALSEYQ